MHGQWKCLTPVRFDKYPGVKHAAITAPGLQLAYKRYRSAHYDNTLPYDWHEVWGRSDTSYPVRLLMSLDSEIFHEILPVSSSLAS